MPCSEYFSDAGKWAFGDGGAAAEETFRFRYFEHAAGRPPEWRPRDPLVIELDGEPVTIIVTKETLSIRTRRKKYRHYIMNFRLVAGGPIYKPKPTMQRSWTAASISGFHIPR